MKYDFATECCGIIAFVRCLWDNCQVEVGDRRKRCEEHAHRHHISATMEQRRQRHSQTVWAPKQCVDCGVTFDPKEGRDITKAGPPHKRCVTCRSHKPVTRRQGADK